MGEVIKRLAYLDLAIERATEKVPDDGRYYITRGDKILNSAPSDTIAAIYLEEAEEEILKANPSIVSPRQMLARERQTREIISVRVESAQIGKAKATAKGGKGGRSGV